MLPIHFGLQDYIPYVLYASAIGAFLLSIFWRPIVGVFYLLPLIPLQTLRYRMNDLPLGASVFGVMLVGIAIGLWRSGQPLLPKNWWFKLLAFYFLFTFVSLWLGSTYLGTSLPLPGDTRFGVWQEYMVMPALCIMTAAAVRTKRQMQLLVLTMCVGTLLLDKSFWDAVGDRDFSNYSDDLHSEGANMGYAGSNGLAAFTAQASIFLLALAGFEKKFSIRLAYYGLATYSAICLMYSLSRGGYVAFLVGCAVLGLMKQRKLLLLLGIFCFTWTSIVPPAVQQRVEMTYDRQDGSLDHSSETRLSLWTSAMQVFDGHEVLGTGFETYRYMHLNKGNFGGYYTDTHNYFVKVLLETGIVGLILFLCILCGMFIHGFRLFRHARDPFVASLGLGIIGWLVCSITANLFGDRWTYPQVNGYMWAIAGIVFKAYELERNEPRQIAAEYFPPTEASMAPSTGQDQILPALCSAEDVDTARIGAGLTPDRP